MRERALAIRAEGPVKAVSALRDFTPHDQVHARLQLTGKGLLRKPTAGVDVRGDGTFVPFRGGVAREELDPTDYETPFDVSRDSGTKGDSFFGMRMPRMTRPRFQRAATRPATG